MNLLAFESVEQYKEVLHDDTFVKIPFKKWPTVGNETMKKYAYTTWQPDAPYVILLNTYKGKYESETEWVRGFRGKRLCVVDGGDKGRYWEPFVSVADVYIKENSYRNTDRDNVRIGCYCPSMKVPFLLKKHKIEWCERRVRDWLFCGDMHKARKRHVKKWVHSGLKGKWGDEHTYGRPQYLKEMGRSRMAPSFRGYGDRCRREWEALLTGALLVQDERLVDYPFVVMQPGKHFSFEAKWNEKIACAGYDLARKCWMCSPSIDIRMAALYTFFDVPQMWTYDELVAQEEKLL